MKNVLIYDIQYTGIYNDRSFLFTCPRTYLERHQETIDEDEKQSHSFKDHNDHRCSIDVPKNYFRKIKL